jgi:hypothetical protein
MAKLKSGTRIYGTATIDTSVVVGSAVTLSSSGIQVTGISTLGVTSATNLTSQQLNISGISTFVNGPILVGTGTSTGTASQPLQVTGGAYVRDNVGIGTTNPFGSNIYSGLDVNSTNAKIFARNIGTSYDASVWAADQDYFSIPSYKGVGILKYGPGTAGTIFGSIPYADLGALSFQNNTNALIYTNGQTSLIFGTFSTERVRINGLDGNMGIGTTNPSQTLHVQGNARVTGAIYDSTNSPGTSGQVLQSTVSGTQWAPASSIDLLEVMLFS